MGRSEQGPWYVRHEWENPNEASREQPEFARQSDLGSKMQFLHLEVGIITVPGSCGGD